MEVGKLVRHRNHTLSATGIVVDMTEKKVWRAGCMGKKVDWGVIDPEPHAVVLFHHNDGTIEIPVCDLEVVDESG